MLRPSTRLPAKSKTLRGSQDVLGHPSGTRSVASARILAAVGLGLFFVAAILLKEELLLENVASLGTEESKTGAIVKSPQPKPETITSPLPPPNLTKTIPPPPGQAYECDCSDRSCRKCHRGIISVHKMGFTVQLKISSIVFANSVKIAEITAHDTLGDQFERSFREPSMDYRHVLVTRNLYSSLVSGYLYHRSGKECWLDWFGKERPNFQGWLRDNKQEDWEARIAQTPTRAVKPWPESSGRDLCRYLMEESEFDGLRVYMEWALAIFFRPFHQFWTDRRAIEGDNYKTVHMCYEDEMNDFHGSVQRMSEFFGIPVKREKVEADFKRIQSDGAGHETDNDPQLRTRLKDIIATLDLELYNNTFATWDKELGCGA